MTDVRNLSAADYAAVKQTAVRAHRAPAGAAEASPKRVCDMTPAEYEAENPKNASEMTPEEYAAAKRGLIRGKI